MKEVALGRIDSLVAPAMWEVDASTLQVAPQELLEQIEEWAGRPWSDGAPEASARAFQQMEAVASDSGHVFARTRMLRRTRVNVGTMPTEEFLT